MDCSHVSYAATSPSARFSRNALEADLALACQCTIVSSSAKNAVEEELAHRLAKFEVLVHGGAHEEEELPDKY